MIYSGEIWKELKSRKLSNEGNHENHIKENNFTGKNRALMDDPYQERKNRGEKKKKWKELDIKIIQIREIQYMDNKCPRRKRIERSVQGWTRRKTGEG